MKLDYAEGSYNLSFFNIIIETEEELSQNVLEKNKSTFVHEFIHYIQDLILPYNIRYNLSNVRWFFNILDSAHRNGRINRPFGEWNIESSTLLTQFLRSFGGVTGNYKFINSVSKIGDATSDFVITSGVDGNLNILREHRVYKYNLPVYRDGEVDPIVYNLGARDLLEYIAYKIELKNFPNRPPAPQLPYESIDLIFCQYGLSYISDNIRLCIAERCLYNDTPIHFLLNTLLSDDKFKEFITNSSYEEIYNYLYFSTTVTRDGHSESLIDKTERRLMQLANEIQKQYSGFSEIGRWLLKLNQYIKNNLSGKFIFSDIYKMDSNEMFDFIDDVIDCIGVPLIINKNQNCISLQTNEIEILQFIQFYILQNFIAFTKSKIRCCPIYNLCKANGGICNENCILNEQQLIKGNRDCYYTKFLETYELLDIKFD